MKILMLVNWKIEYGNEIPEDKQPPDYYVKGEKYWFYRYFMNSSEVDVVDISSIPWIELFEKNVIRFYIWQTLKIIPKLKNYDLVVSHGMQSGVVLSLYRRFFKTKAKHVVFDIGSFNSAAEKGFALKLMQFASKSIDGIIYHTSNQIEYYKKYFPWLVKQSKYIKFGTDLEFFSPNDLKKSEDKNQYIICVGYAKRDWDTVIKAYKSINTNIKLRFVGKPEKENVNISGIEYLQFLPIKELIGQIYNAKFAILPLESFNYSYGQMTLLQQMSLGKCVIAARVPSLVDYIEHEETALLYNPKDVQDLAEKIQQLLDDDVKLNKIAYRGQAYLKNKCNEQIMAKEIEDYYISVYEGV